MNPQFPLKRVLIGTLKYHPRVVDVEGHYPLGPDGQPDSSQQWISATYTQPRYEWIDSGKRGLLYGFFPYTNDGESGVVGLVENPDGSFDTHSAECLKLETPTVQP